MLDTSRQISESLDLTRFFAGRTSAWGLFEDRFGTMRRRFSVTIDGAWRGEEFVMDEAFRFDDGSAERRVWRIRPKADGRFMAVADDVVGEAAGSLHGPTVIIRYKLMINAGPLLKVVRFDDRMHRIDEHTVINRATISKFGIRLGTVTILFRREDTGAFSRQARPVVAGSPG